MSFKLSIGRIAVTDRDVYPNEAIVWIDPDDTCRRDYLAHYLAASDVTTGTVRAVKGATLNSRSLAAIEIMLPSVDEQRAIEQVLEAQRLQVAACEVAALAVGRFRSCILAMIANRALTIPASHDGLLAEAV